MKHVFLLLAACLGLLLAGCGGSDGNGGTPPTTSQPRIEAVVRNDPSTIQDPTNFQINEAYYFQLVRYASDGTREVLDDVQWSTSDEFQKYGSIASNNGLFTTGSTETLTPEIVRAVWDNRVFTARWSVLPRQGRIQGRVVRNTAGGPGVDGVRVVFYAPIPENPTVLEEVGSVTTSYDGSFRGSVPVSATAFRVDPTSVPLTFARNFTYIESTYDMEDVEATAPLPSPVQALTPLDGPIILTAR